MAECTAPVRGHRSASAAAACPVCRYSSRSSSYRTSYTPYTDRVRNYNSSNYSSGSNGKRRASWSSGGSTILYTPSEIRTLTPIRENIIKRSDIPDLRDVFLCHAWDDRKSSAKQLHDLLEVKGVSVWFSEKDVLLGAPLLREIDKGLANSRVGIVLVTPSFLKRVEGEGIAEKELSALLARDLLVPIIHDTTYEELREISPLLGSRSGLNTSVDSMDEIASKLSELLSVENPNCFA